VSEDIGLRKSYDREAAHYDERRYHSADGRMFSELELQVLRSWLSLTPDSRVLDVPAGTGRLSFALAASGAQVIAADISANMLHMAATKSGPGLDVHLTQTSGSALPFRDNMFDAVVSFKFFHLVANDRKRDFIREMTRVLKPGGSLIAEFNSPFYGGVLAAIRYYLLKKNPGGMRMKCLFPDQVSALFEGLEVRRTRGIKLPLSGPLVKMLGRRRADKLDSWFGCLPGVKYLSYVIIVEAKKPLAGKQS
jgi:ubiquinone/menaquinone biosynthesis C-methylase UbiE